MNKILDNYIPINIIISVIILCAVYVLEYFFNMVPCDMCVNERYPYFIIIILGVMSYAIKSKINFTEIITKFIFSLVYFIGLLYALYHVGIERKYWIGNSKCSGKGTAMDIETLSSQLMNIPVIRCDEPKNFI